MDMSTSNLTDFKVVPIGNSQFVKPLSLEYKQNGKQRKWDLVQVHESVSVLIFNISRKVLVLVKQFRPAVYYNSIPAEDRMNIIDIDKYPSSLGLTVELCAGIVDKSKSLVEIAAEEVLEECGYKVDPHHDLEYVIQFRSGVGISGDLQSLFYCEVTDEMKVSQGGGNIDEGEAIEVVEMSIDKISAFIRQPKLPCPGGFLFAIQWFLCNKAPRYIHNI